ncbi:C-terminal processing protease CtpA/Prc, contains a PDZ domain [Belliella buryatensis]|uniref:C-terminal processing protease CtpA/Prc, contains a PDZ domain n=1 Tax=Belliella buryatensis TaxID=1500549 RepID=A0A239D674_9BACT|nr:S41 family peptidase [Belliella buryatensis]SNS27083.1 C-terminal processing protease CtpA/Prc, contains a PDZ domain [Belliella buryatensis]
MENIKIRKIILILIFGFFAFSACQDKDDERPTNDSSNRAVNTWIKAVMDQVYYWLEDMKIPIAINSDPEDYFTSLLFTPTDRFSAIFPNYQELISSLEGTNLEAGYEFRLVQFSNTNSVGAFITYIKKGSPAEEASLRRGDVINAINGTTLTINNYLTALREISSNHSVTYSRYDESENSFVDQGTINLQPIVISENPNFLDTIYTIGDHKIGYVVYHFFAPGVAGQPQIYDNQMDQIFERLKSEGVNELIIDFRYNGGGFVSSAVNLASLVAPSINSESIFSKTKYNSFLSRDDRFKNVQTKFLEKNQNIGNQLKSNKIYILTSARTASASELIINGLKPYLDIEIIGATTMGKNVGSVALEDENNSGNNYGILPIISKSFNSLDQSDYSLGFQPDITINELNFLPFKPFGDLDDPLLDAAISRITGVPSGRQKRIYHRVELESSIDMKIRNGKLIEDKSVGDLIKERIKMIQ